MLKKRSTRNALSFTTIMLAVVMILMLGYFVSQFILPEKLPLTVRSDDAQKVYDGTPLTDDDWAIVSGALRLGHKLSVDVYGEQTIIGSSPNFLDARIVNAIGMDVTFQYELTLQTGTLVVTDPTGGIGGGGGSGGGGSGGGGGGGSEGGEGPSLQVFANRSDILYLRHTSYGNYTGIDFDGRIPSYGNKSGVNPQLFLAHALQAAGYPTEKLLVRTATGKTYAPYHLLSSDVCDADDRVLPYVGSEYTVDYIYEYDVTVLRQLAKYSAPYGSELRRYDSYVRTNYLTLSDEERTVMLSLAAENGISADDDNVIEKVKHYIQNAARYRLDYEPYPAGVNHAIYFLTVAKEGVCEQYATSATLMYRALGIPARYVTGYVTHTVAGEWVEINSAIGHAWVEVYLNGIGWIPVEVTGSAEAPDDTPDGEPDDEPDDKPLKNGLDDSGKLSDNGENSDQVALRVLANTDGKVYFRYMSFGDLTHEGWGAASVYPQTMDGAHGMCYLTSFAMQGVGLPLAQMEVVNLTSQYVLPYFMGMEKGDHLLQSNDVRFEGDTSNPYSLAYYSYRGNGNDLKGVPHVSESAYAAFVRENYLHVDDVTRAFLSTIIAAEGFDAADPYVINEVAEYIQQSAAYNADYPTALDKAEHVVIAFLSEHRQGVCRHYATAATMLFRTLGIPARYTIGYAATVRAGQWCDVTGKQAHAWVEVYLDGIGWLPVEVTGSDSGNEDGGDDENGEAVLGKLTLAPVYLSKKYDGTPLVAQNRIRGFEKWEKLGYTYAVTTVGQQTDYGYGTSRITSLTLYDPEGNDVTKEFAVKTENGSLHIYYSILTSDSHSVTKIYDGVPVDVSYVHPVGDLMEGHRIVVRSTASVNAGNRQNTYSVTVLDADGEDVTRYYECNNTYGTLVIQPIRLLLKAKDASRVWDGTTLTCPGYLILAGELADGQVIAECVISGSQTDIGRSESMITAVVIRDDTGKDVTGNYIIELQSGKLTVTLR